MDVCAVQRLGEDLDEFVADVFGSLARSGWQDRAGDYLRGLMLDGRRKSIQPMAARLAGPNDQALNHFVTHSPWDAGAVRGRLAVRMNAAISPQAWALDDTGWLKSGGTSVCVTRQYTGTAGKVTNCQVGVSLNLVTDTASCPVNWRLFVPEAWDPGSDRALSDVAARRAAAAMPADAVHQEKWRLGLEMIDEAIGWGVAPPLILADAGYGDAAEFRQGLDDRALPYIVGVNCAHTAFTVDIQRTAPPYKGNGRRPPLIYREVRIRPIASARLSPSWLVIMPWAWNTSARAPSRWSVPGSARRRVASAVPGRPSGRHWSGRADPQGPEGLRPRISFPSARDDRTGRHGSELFCRRRRGFRP